MSLKEKLLASAQKNLQKGQIAKAIKDYQQVVELDPKDIRNRQKLAELYCRAGMNAEALDEYDAVARYYADNGFYLKAIAVYKQMQRIDPEQVNVGHRLAELNVKQGLLGNAVAEYRNLVVLFEKKKLLTDAIGVLHKIAELEPENLQIHVRVAEFYARAGLREKARDEFALVLQPLRETGEFTRVAKLYELFLPLFPNDPEIKAGLADALVRKGEIDKGMQLLKTLLRDDPENCQILKTLAFGYREAEDYENERLTYQHLLKQAPGDLALREGYIQACIDGGEHRRALEELDEWKEAFLDAGQVSLLKDFYEAVLKAFPGNEQVQRALSVVQGHTGDEKRISGAVSAGPELAERAPATGLTTSENAAEEIEGSVPTEISSPAQLDCGPTAGQNKYDADSCGTEESSLEFLEALSEFAEPLPALQPVDVFAGLLQGSIGHGAGAEELELELELEVDEPLLPLEIQQNEQCLEDRGGEALEEPVASEVEDWTAEADAKASTDEDFVELDPEEILDELEELEELEPEEILQEVEPEELFEALERIAHSGTPETLAAKDADQEKIDSESLGSELRDLLSGLDSFPGPGVKARDELEEAEFYLQQGLLDDAERVCRQLLASEPGCTEAQEKLKELAALRQKAVGSPAEHELFDHSGALLDDKTWGGHGEMPGLNEFDRLGLADGVDGFENNIESQIDAEDSETHYNLGIAYKEMGLLDDAVAEFDKAMQNPGRLVDSLALKGTCLFEKGAFDQAEEVFKSGLFCPGLNATERISLHYEMGLLYEAWGRPLEALDSFQSAADADLFFRNVGEKIEALRKTLGLDAQPDKEDPDVKGSRNRVSYI